MIGAILLEDLQFVVRVSRTWTLMQPERGKHCPPVLSVRHPEGSVGFCSAPLDAARDTRVLEVDERTAELILAEHPGETACE